MYKLTQLDLLMEGFWDNFTKPARIATGIARGAIAGTAKALDYALPELTKPLHGAESALRDIGRSAKEGFEKGSQGIKERTAQKLEESGYQLDPNSRFVKNGDNYVVGARKISGYDQKGQPRLANTLTSFLVDKGGNILRTRGGTK